MVCCHNQVRNQVFRAARAAALNPELEKPGLLLPARPEDLATGRRRPADVYLPAWIHGSPVAFDIAVTAPQRQGVLETAATTALAAATAYSATKRTHLGTDALCRASGVQFQPLVCESTGAWAPEAFTVLHQLAQATATHSGKDFASVLAELLQRLSVTVRRAQARALLRRLAA